MTKVFAVTSGKGGVGKSTVAIGLSLAMCKLGKKVLLVDLDEGLRCLDLMLGIDESAIFDLADILSGKDIEDALYPCEFCDSLFLIPAPAKTGGVDAASFKEFAYKVTNMFDAVIFDFPAGINTALYSCLPSDTQFLTVAVPCPVSIRDAAAVSNELSELSFGSRLIINRFIYKQSKKIKSKNIDSIIDNTAVRLVGIVPESEELLTFSLRHKIKKKGKAMCAFVRIAKRLLGETILLPKTKKI